MKGFFVRLERRGFKYDANHRSYRPPTNWQIGEYISPEEGTLTEGMAAFPLVDDIEKILGGDDFVIVRKADYPDCCDWKKDELTRDDLLQSGYVVSVIYGEILEELFDGYIISPLSLKGIVSDAREFEDDKDVGLVERMVLRGASISYGA